MGQAYLTLRVCERMGIDPERFDALAPGMQAMLAEYDRIRRMEEMAAMQGPSGSRR